MASTKYPYPDETRHASGLWPARGQAPQSPRNLRDADPAETKQRICVGVITGPQGVRGALRIKSFTEVPEAIAGYGPVADETGRRRFELQLCGAARGVLIAHIPGVEDRDQAEALRGLRLYLARAALPETAADEYYHADLIGLAAVLGDGTPVGHVRAIYDFGAGDTLELVRSGGPSVLVPFTRAVVPLVEPARGRLVLNPPPGLFDDDRP
jgi:16S rRNA processing protein RimM